MKENHNDSRSTNFKQSWFWKQIIDNKVVSVLLVSLLIFFNIFMLGQISIIFRPVEIILSIVGPPIVFSAIFYYLLSPVVDWLEKKRFTRNTAIAFVFALIILFFIVGINFIVPIIQKQLESLIENWPTYWNSLMVQLDELLGTEAFTGFMDQLSETSLIGSLSGQASGFLDVTVGGIGSFIGTLTQVGITLFTTPFILYYLLKDGGKVPDNFLKVVPTKIRGNVREILEDINKQISFYVRGQLIVAAAVGIMFWIGFSIVGLDFALTLGIFAGFMNLIPYLGSFLAMIPAVIVAIVDSPFMLVTVLVVFGIEQVLEGRVISPQILGNTLKIHPINIIFLLLVAGRLFGVMGVILAIPGYAVLKIIVSRTFAWYQKRSGLYEEKVSTNDAVLVKKEEND
ncbi:AI-2E family transporter [Marinilactibacillus sp. 15R]|uniref:AI-2E family transporter n=1 Tax=Marinilactibacillus sp. 15R TaxID=1911586 RepID=UPI0009099519|nr:AI-2E family transporter [Marinilactibacillus sp. 15R]API88888.1 AI-2E family transporter [Marinilactibacillus sp. 15R]